MMFSTDIFVDILANMLKTQAKEMMSQRKAARASRRVELDAQVILRQINKGLVDSAWEACLLADAQSYVLVINELNNSYVQIAEQREAITKMEAELEASGQVGRNKFDLIFKILESSQLGCLY